MTILLTSKSRLTGSERMRRNELRDLPPLSGAGLVGSAEMYSRIDTRIDHLISSLAKSLPLAGDASDGDGDRHARIVPEQKCERLGHSSAVRGMSRRVLRMRR